MANFTALKTAINNAIKTNGNEEITGAILQAILDAMVETLGDSAINDLENAITTEVTNRENAVGDVAANLAAEALARANKDNQLDGRINQEEYNRQNADAALSRTIDQGFQTLNSQMTVLNAAISALNAAYRNGYLYGGIATPSSSPSNNKCFYIALQGGTYTNFGGVGVVEGINILKNDSGWKVEHIYDQTTLLNEFYLLRQQVIQAITSFAPIVIEGDVTNAPDEEDLTSNANHLLQFKNNAYSPLEFSGLGRKYLRKNIAPLSESAPFNGFVEGVTAEATLSGTPTQIFWDRMNTRFVGIKDGVYYLDWTDSDNYVPVSTSLVYMYNGTPYQWTGSDFIVDETEVPNLVNCLTEDMINEANTIYIIRYDYTLKEDITIPANCVLQFDGGSISGEHTITGTNTGIQAGLVKIFNINITLAGSWNIAEAYPEWFGDRNDVSINKAIQFASSTNIKKVILSNFTYSISDSIVIGPDLYFGTDVENIPYEWGTKCTLEATTNIPVIRIAANAHLDGITLNGFRIKGYSKTNENSIGIKIEAGDLQVYYNIFKNISIFNTRYAIYAPTSSGGYCYNKFDNVRCQNNVINLKFDGNGYSYINENIFINCVLGQCDICGVRINNFISSQNNTFLNCSFEGIGVCSLEDYNTFGGVQAYKALAGPNGCEFISCYFENVYPRISGKTDEELLPNRMNAVIMLEKGAGASLTNCVVSHFYRVFYVKQYGRVTTKNNFYIQKVSNDIEGLVDINIEIASGSAAAIAYTSIDITEFEEIIGTYTQHKKAINSIKNGNISLWPTQTTAFIMNVNSNYLKDRTINGYGAYADKPVYVPRGTQYFCSDLETPRPIYWTGSAWVDATGATV